MKRPAREIKYEIILIYKELFQQLKIVTRYPIFVHTRLF